MNLEDSLQAVRTEFMSRMRRGNGQLLLEVEEFVTSRLGKMLRPQFTLLAADTLGQTSSRRTILLATAVEMLHNASLLHDDIIDHSDTRRGKPSVNARWNNAVAVLVGDFLLAQVMRILHEVNEPDTTRRIYQTVEAMVEAELLAQEVAVCDADRYLRIIDGKTACLFATACALGNPEYEEFGLHYGRLFQLQDDIDDGEANEYTEEIIRQEKNILATIKPSLTIPNIK
jgi:octaprenyl-diphosphate synthase